MTEYHDNSLWLTFRLDGRDYCILSDYIESITIPGEIHSVPDSSLAYAGITTYSGSSLGVIELRELFSAVNLKTYIEQFAIMKEMHASWVVDLKRFVYEGVPFTKAVNPHKCKFGIWYDNFQTDNNRLNRLLKKISTPHERIHRCGASIITLRNESGDHEPEILELLNEADAICQKEIVPLLDRLIDIYRAVNRGVLLVIRQENGRRTGFLVDDVRRLIPCSETILKAFSKVLQPSRFVRQMVIKDDLVLLEIHVEQILGQHTEGVGADERAE